MKYHDLELAWDALANYKRVIEAYRPGMKAEDIQFAMNRIHRILFTAKREAEKVRTSGFVHVILDVSELREARP